MRKRVPMRDAGADQLVVAPKPGNSGGAKGLNRPAESEGQPNREEPRTKAKSYCISKQVVWEAYKRVKANRGSAGVDGESMASFEEDLKGNLYKVWNRMSSGSYFPPPVRLVEIPKKDGGQRPLGIPTLVSNCTSYNAASDFFRWFWIRFESRTHARSSSSFSWDSVIQ